MGGGVDWEWKQEEQSPWLARGLFEVKTGRCGFLFVLMAGLKYPSQFYKRAASQVLYDIPDVRHSYRQVGGQGISEAELSPEPED